MEEKTKNKKISLSTFLLILAIIVIIVMSIFIYKFYNDKIVEIKKSEELQTQVNSLNGTVNDLQNTINNISETINSNKQDVNLESNTKDIQNTINNNLINELNLRQETSGSSNFYIKDSKLYSESSNKIISLGNEIPKYVVPVDKQIGLSLVLTNEGNLWTNDDTSLDTFKLTLKGYNVIEIVEKKDKYNSFPYCFLTDSNKIIDLTGSEVDLSLVK